MKKVHLLCNAHLDPVWLWRKDEGLAEAISTFRVAADFCEEYDAFVFNHNEALLYEWVEEYEPELFERIKKLVADGKWYIMGGWYLQPDCNMPSGESFIAQIELGREYFKEKFGVEPKTAINFDPFGHTRGLVQIMKKWGYDNYVFMRPFGVAKGDFLWEGFDGSKIIGHNTLGVYLSHKGKAIEKIEHDISASENDTVLCLWGIGNHGGGPSKIDLDNIEEYIKNSEHEIIHSNCDDYFKEVDTSKLKTISETLGPNMVGCYTSMSRIKQANRRLENKIAVTEKIMNYADLQFKNGVDNQELKKAKKALAFCQFHDILPGTCIKSGEDDALQTFRFGEEIADTLYNKAFFKLCEGQRKAENGTIPVLAFNPHPYEIEEEFEISFLLENQNLNEGEFTIATVYDEDGNKLLSQNEKPYSSLNLDWCKKLSFRAKLKPSSITRFNCKLEAVKADIYKEYNQTGDFIEVKNDKMLFKISRKTGLIEEYKIDGKLIAQNTGLLEVYKDNEDPWGMTVSSFRDFEDKFELMSDEEANEFTGYAENTTPNVRIVEDGEVRIRVQTFWKYKRNTAVVEYTIPKNDVYIDVNVILYSNMPNKMIKFKVDTAFSGAALGSTAFGYQEMLQDGTENVFQKWCGIKGDTQNLLVVNEGIYGGDFSENTIRLSLLRTPVYSGHPIDNKDVTPHDRFTDHIDMGERRFKFRLTNFENAERKAQAFNEAPRLLSFFPSGEGKKTNSTIKIDNANVILSSIRKKGDRYSLTLYNGAENPQTATIKVAAKNITLSENFTKYELKVIEI